MATPDLDAIKRTLTGLYSPVTLKAAAMPHSGRVIIEPVIAPTLADADRWVSIALVSAEAAMIEAGYTATYLGKGAFAVLIVAGTPDSEAVEEAALDLDAIEARAEAATEGPWHWFGNTASQQLGLGYWRKGWGRCTVMDFARWGMQSARPRFSDADAMMHDADAMAIWEVNPRATRASDPSLYRHDVIGIRHPDAEFIAHARTDVPVLVAEVRRLTAEVEHWKSRRDAAVETCRHRHQDGLTAEEWHRNVCAAARGAVRERERAERLEADLQFVEDLEESANRHCAIWQARALRAEGISAGEMASTITIPTPTISTGPKGVSEARAAADFLHSMRQRTEMLRAGSGVTALVNRLLDDVVAAIRASEAGGDGR